ncbi:hypothetical protein FH972_024066 [Carpinus fangiana]|uniref:Endonuclease/exonuclease/phosphatase domain-containing protein n=1 Tax=Carpinus fangiana TaxID=176857 RepID=A0A5N6KWY0_9ROSI|nr:hypothetical protein FH972_024066 [Carpinus fangiana]
MPLRITTWNVNGIRNPFAYQPWRQHRSFEAMFDLLEADIVVMQELKIQRKDLRDDMVLVHGWDCYFSLPKHKKGYSGVAIYTRQAVCAPIRAEEGLLGVLCPPNSKLPYCELADHIGGYLSATQLDEVAVNPVELDGEGRCVVVEFPAFVLFGIYSPANSSGLRDDFRYGFLNALDTRIRNLVNMGKRVVVTGDLNVSREEIDTAKAEESCKKDGITHEEYVSTPNRRIFNQLLDGGDVVGDRDPGREHPAMWDICRAFHPTRRGMYTHWEQKINARPGNFGSRIDFILCSLDMKSWFLQSDIQEGFFQPKTTTRQVHETATPPPETPDPIVSKESWSTLFTKPKLPLCESHHEPCKRMQTKKPGFNCGREFYIRLTLGKDFAENNKAPATASQDETSNKIAADATTTLQFVASGKLHEHALLRRCAANLRVEGDVESPSLQDHAAQMRKFCIFKYCEKRSGFNVKMPVEFSASGFPRGDVSAFIGDEDSELDGEDLVDLRHDTAMMDEDDEDYLAHGQIDMLWLESL